MAPRKPWAITYRLDAMPRSTTMAFYDQSSADREAAKIARIGRSVVEVSYRREDGLLYSKGRFGPGTLHEITRMGDRWSCTCGADGRKGTYDLRPGEDHEAAIAAFEAGRPEHIPVEFKRPRHVKYAITVDRGTLVYVLWTEDPVKARLLSDERLSRTMLSSLYRDEDVEVVAEAHRLDRGPSRGWTIRSGGRSYGPIPAKRDMERQLRDITSNYFADD